MPEYSPSALSMKAPSIFGLILRLVGLFFLYRAATLSVEVVSYFLAGPVIVGGVRLPGSNPGMAIGYALAATWFIKGAPPYSNWAYPDEKSTEQAE